VFVAANPYYGSPFEGCWQLEAEHTHKRGYVLTRLKLAFGQRSDKSVEKVFEFNDIA